MTTPTTEPVPTAAAIRINSPTLAYSQARRYSPKRTFTTGNDDERKCRRREVLESVTIEPERVVPQSHRAEDRQPDDDDIDDQELTRAERSGLGHHRPGPPSSCLRSRVGSRSARGSRHRRRTCERGGTRHRWRASSGGSPRGRRDPGHPPWVRYDRRLPRSTGPRPPASLPRGGRRGRSARRCRAARRTRIGGAGRPSST